MAAGGRGLKASNEVWLWVLRVSTALRARVSEKIERDSPQLPQGSPMSHLERENDKTRCRIQTPFRNQEPFPSPPLFLSLFFLNRLSFFLFSRWEIRFVFSWIEAGTAKRDEKYSVAIDDSKV